MKDRKDESSKLARDVGEAAIERSVAGGLEILADAEGVDELAEAAPHVGFVVKLVKWGLAKRDARRARAFFGDLAKLLDMGSAEEAAEHVARHMEYEWAQEAVVRGLRAIMDAVDDDARRCISALVARYISGRELPDLAYKQVAALLADCDGDWCRRFALLLGLFPNDAGSTGEWLVLESEPSSRGQSTAWFRRGPTKTRDTESPYCVFSNADIAGLRAKLVQHQLGYAPEPGVGAGGLEIAPNHFAPLLLLRDCLEAGVGKPGGGSDVA